VLSSGTRSPSVVPCLLVSCLACSSTLKVDANVPLKLHLIFSALLYVISQKVDMFLSTNFP
jgi:hypothetical protein